MEKEVSVACVPSEALTEKLYRLSESKSDGLSKSGSVLKVILPDETSNVNEVASSPSIEKLTGSLFASEAVTKKEKGSPSTKEISCERLVMTGAKFIELLAVSKQEKLKNVWLPTRFRFKRRKSAGDEFSFKDPVPFQGLPMASES
jgi:hypothetical protein